MIDEEEEFWDDDDHDDSDYDPNEEDEEWSDSDSDAMSLEDEEQGSEPNELYCSKGGEEKIMWDPDRPQPHGRFGSANVVHRAKVLMPGIPDPVTHMDSFKLFLTEESITRIYHHTRARSQGMLDNCSLNEFKAFIGVLILTGCHRSSKTNTKELWSVKYGMPFLRVVMSRNRFVLILRFLCFESADYVAAHKRTDKLAGLRNFTNALAERCRAVYAMSEYVTVDEMLSPFFGRCPIRQFIKEKLAKFGVKLWMLCDADSPSYCGNFQVYVGAPTINGHKVREAGLATRVVKDLCQYIYNTGRNVTMDNYFTNVSLVRDLFRDGLTTLGTIGRNRVGLPQIMLSNARGASSVIYAFHGPMVAISYAPPTKPAKKVKVVTLLSSMVHSDELVDGKPIVIKEYNITKGGVDTFTELCKEYTCKRSTRKWWKSLWFTFVDICMQNGYAVWMRDKSRNVVRNYRSTYFQTVGEELCAAWIEERLANPAVHLQPKIRLCMRFLGMAPPTGMHGAGAGGGVDEGSARKRARTGCHLCPPRKLASAQCDKCEKNICRAHQLILCREGGCVAAVAAEGALAAEVGDDDDDTEEW